MTPLTVNPTVVIRINADSGKVVNVATNVAPDLNVVVVENDADYAAEAANKPFDTARPVTPERAFTSKH